MLNDFPSQNLLFPGNKQNPEKESQPTIENQQTQIETEGETYRSAAGAIEP